jgi:ribonuclease R
MITKGDILKFLTEEADRPIMDMDLFRHFDLEPQESGEYYRLLTELEENGEIIKTKKNKVAIPIKMDILVGKIQTTQKGFGFLILEDKEKDDVFIPAGALAGAMNGDKVFVKIVNRAGGNKRSEGEVIKIITRANEKIVGTFESNESFGFVVPDDKHIAKDIYVKRESFNGAKTGQKVVVTLTEYPEERRNPVGYVSEVLGFPNEKGVDILSVIRKYQLPESFPKKVHREAEGVEQFPSEEEIMRRRDLRQERIFTIDGADAKDLDDAVSVVALPNGHYRLGVHIADVTYYVKERSPLDKEAFDRGTSVYLIDRVIPMLPRELSNGICSLNPHVDRLTMSCTMEIDRQGVVVAHEIFESVIHSTERLIYEDVSDMLEAVERDDLAHLDYLKEDFVQMEILCSILRKKRERRGAIDFDFPEPKIILDETGKPIEIAKRERRIANRIIEEFMLAANETVAEHMFWLELPFVYRIHEDPDLEKIATFNKFLNNLGYTIKGITEEIHPKSVQQLLNEVKGKKEEGVVNRLMLRSLKQARYSSIQDGHFGLAAEYYSHFTSPIRRYPDLQIHRIIREMLQDKLSDDRIKALAVIVEAAAKQSSERERIAEQAERETDDMKKAEYMAGFIGESFEGIISSVTSFGLFVELSNTCEGLTRIGELEDDYYIYDENALSYVGQHTRKTYCIGDKVLVRVERVSVINREVDFKIMEKLEA